MPHRCGHHVSNVRRSASPAMLYFFGGRYRIRTCAPRKGRRLSKPVHYHSANLPGIGCAMPVTGSGVRPIVRPVSRSEPFAGRHLAAACLVAEGGFEPPAYRV